MKKVYKPTMKNIKNVTSTTSVIYLVHNHLDLTILFGIHSFRLFGPLDLDTQI